MYLLHNHLRNLFKALWLYSCHCLDVNIGKCPHAQQANDVTNSKMAAFRPYSSMDQSEKGFLKNKSDREECR